MKRYRLSLGAPGCVIHPCPKAPIYRKTPAALWCGALAAATLLATGLAPTFSQFASRGDAPSAARPDSVAEEVETEQPTDLEQSDTGEPLTPHGPTASPEEPVAEAVSAQPEEQVETTRVAPPRDLIPFSLMGGGADLDTAPGPVFETGGFSVRIGPVVLRGTLDVTASWTDNVFGSQTNAASDFETLISPAIYGGIGDFVRREGSYLRLFWRPTIKLYAVHSSLDTVDQAIAIDGELMYPKLKVAPFFSYLRISGVDSDIGGYQQQDQFRGSLATAYLLGPKTSLLFTPAVYASLYQSGFSSTTAQATAEIRYQLTSKLQFGGGGAFGVTTLDPGGLQAFEVVQLRASYDTLEKLSFSGLVGVQFRQYNSDTNGPVGSEDSFLITPVFALSARYRPFDSQTWSLALDRVVRDSAFNNGQTIVSTGVSLEFEQRLLQRIFFSLNVRYSLDEYEQVGGFAGQRTDNNLRIRPSLEYAFHENYRLSIFYELYENTSTRGGSGFTINRVGVTGAITF